MSKVYDQIRYSNCWEDADLLLEGLNIEKGDRVLSIGSGGDNSFSLLTRDPDLVHIIDINPHQIAIIKLKVAAYSLLNYDELLDFLGFTQCDFRLELYKKVSGELDKTTLIYWDKNQDLIEKGLIYVGKFDRYLRTFSQKVVPFIHNHKKREQLFVTKSDDEQKRFYLKKWNTFMWRSFFMLFFSKRFMALAGRHPSFFEQVKEPVNKTILSRTKKHFSKADCQKNYFLFYMLFGHFGNGLPHYVRKENYEKIKSNLHRLKISLNSVENIEDVQEKFDCFNLSNIFEYQDEFTFHATAAKLKDLGKVGSRYAYWNLLVPRTLHQTDSAIFKRIYDAESQDVNDNGFFYSNFYVSMQK